MGYDFSSALKKNLLLSCVVWGLLFMKVYATAPVLAGKVGADEGIFREKSWKVVKAIASLKCCVVSKTNMTFLHTIIHVLYPL